MDDFPFRTPLYDKALALCRGSFQRGLIEGTQRISLSDLKGKALKYKTRYAKSRDSLLSKLYLEHIPFFIDKKETPYTLYVGEYALEHIRNSLKWYEDWLLGIDVHKHIYLYGHGYY